MNSCNHVGWFNLSGRDCFQIHYNHRTACLIDQITNPSTQQPSLILFLGRKSKDAALREIFPNNNIGRGHRDSIVSLRLDSSTISADRPLLFADADPFSLIPPRTGGLSCHATTVLPLKWRSSCPSSTFHQLLARLVAPFTDVICIFADDFGGVESVTEFLKHWVEYGNPADSPAELRPRVVIVIREDEMATTHEVLAIENLRHEIQQNLQESRPEIFSSISILHLAGNHISSLARHRRLKDFLHTEIKHSRCERVEYRMHFTAIHFESFFRQAVCHVADSATQPFSFIGATRINNKVGDDYKEHLINYIRLGKDFYLPYEKVTSFIASSILMDAYPPRMHSMLISLEV